MTQRLRLAAPWIWRGLIATIVCTSLAACGGGGGGFSADGGVSGSGISSVTGNVTEVVGANGDVGGIRVLVQGTDIETVTDENGGFTLSGEFEGPVTLVFETDDGGRAETTVDVPTGGNVDLEDVTLDPESEQALPTRETVEFAGVVASTDCGGAALVVIAGDVEFTIALDDAFVHDAAGSALRCEAIQRGDDANVQGEVRDDGRIGNADVEISRPEPTATATPEARPTPAPTPTSRDVLTPGRTADLPRATPTVNDADRPRPTETVPDADRPRPTPTATRDVQPIATATARIAPLPQRTP